MSGRGTRWTETASSPAPADGTGELPAPEATDIETLSGRALAAARAAERLAAQGRIRLDALTDQRAALGAGAAALALAGGSLGAACIFGWIAPDPVWTAGAAIIAVASGSALCAVAQTILTRRRHTAALAVASDLASARQCSVTARRIDTVLAGIYGRGGPGPADRQMVAALLRLVERDVEALEQKSGAGAPQRGPARRHERIVPRQTRTAVHTADGRVLAARIIDISLSGVAIETDLPGVPVGAEVRIGDHPAKVVRKLQRGLAFEFKTPLAGSRVDADVVL